MSSSAAPLATTTAAAPSSSSSPSAPSRPRGGSVRSAPSYSLSARVFHRLDVPPHARAAKQYIHNFLQSNILRHVDFSSSTPSSSTSPSSSLPPWDSSSYKGSSVRLSLAASWDTTEQKFDEKYYRKIENAACRDAFVERRRNLLEGIRKEKMEGAAAVKAVMQRRKFQFKEKDIRRQQQLEQESKLLEKSLLAAHLVGSPRNVNNIKKNDFSNFPAPASASFSAIPSNESTIAHLPAHYVSPSRRETMFNLSQRAKRTVASSAARDAADRAAVGVRLDRREHLYSRESRQWEEHRMGLGMEGRVERGRRREKVEEVDKEVKEQYSREALLEYLGQQADHVTDSTTGDAGNGNNSTLPPLPRLDSSSSPSVPADIESTVERPAFSSSVPFPIYRHPGDWVAASSTWTCCGSSREDSRGCAVDRVTPLKSRKVIGERVRDPRDGRVVVLPARRATGFEWSIGQGVRKVADLTWDAEKMQKWSLSSATKFHSTANVVGEQQLHNQGRFFDHVEYPVGAFSSASSLGLQGGAGGATMASVLSPSTLYAPFSTTYQSAVERLGASGPGVAVVVRHVHPGVFHELHVVDVDGVKRASWTCCGKEGKADQGCKEQIITQEHRWSLE